MRIYLAHSRDFDYQNELYLPRKNSEVFKQYDIILSHDGDNYKHDRDFYKRIDLVTAELSFPLTGLGIKLGFLYDDNKNIYCIHNSNVKISGSVNAITKNIYEYKNQENMLNIIMNIINCN